jgi:hypothetical protein
VGDSENSHMIEDEKQAEVTIAEEDEKDRNQGVKTIGMNEDNAMSIETRVSVSSKSRNRNNSRSRRSSSRCRRCSSDRSKEMLDRQTIGN